MTRVHMRGRLNPHSKQTVSACGLLWRNHGESDARYTTDPASVTCGPCRAMLEYRARRAPEVQDAIASAVAAEREACALLVGSWSPDRARYVLHGARAFLLEQRDMADAIRNRKVAP